MAAPWISSPEMAMRDRGQGGRHRQTGDGRRRRASSDVAMRARVGGHRRRLVPSSAMAMLQLDVRGWSSRHRRMRRCSSEAKKPPRGVRGGKSACGSGRKKPRRRSGRKTARPDVQLGHFSRIFDLSDASGPPWALLDLLLLFLDVLLLRCCCSSRGTVAKLAMRQPFVLFKGLTFQKLCLRAHFAGITIIKC